MSALVLASGSPRRAKILRNLGLCFSVVKTDAREATYPGDPERTVRENAIAKGAACPCRGRVLSADTIVWCGGRIYGKPRDLDEAYAFLRELSGRTHSVFTGVALDGDVRVARTDVTLKELGADDISRYIAKVNPLDRAGAYDIDESGGEIVAGWCGSYENIMGLSVAPLVEWGLAGDGAPVGFFDSGCGGMAILDRFKALCPRRAVTYLSDESHFPYGGKSREDVERFALENARRLIEDEKCKAVVVACNTATSAAIDVLRSAYPAIPFIGVEPAVKPAAAVSKSGKIAVFATEGTVSWPNFARNVARHAVGVDVAAVAAPELVEISERLSRTASGTPEEEENAFLAVKARVEPLLQAGCDAIVLGCTHFTRLAPLFEKAASGRAAVFDGAQAVARRIKDVLERKNA